MALAATQGAVTSIAVDADKVYWTTMDGDVVELPKTGGTPNKLATGQGFAACLAVETQHVFRCNQTTLTVMRRDKNTGP